MKGGGAASIRWPVRPCPSIQLNGKCRKFRSITAIGVSALWVAGLGAIIDLGMGSTSIYFTRTSLPFVVMNHMFIMLAWTAAFMALGYWRRSKAEEIRSTAAIGLAREAQLQMLRYQLNPHFLFNALASLRALIGEDPYPVFRVKR